MMDRPYLPFRIVAGSIDCDGCLNLSVSFNVLEPPFRCKVGYMVITRMDVHHIKKENE